MSDLTDTAENDGGFAHRINVNIGGPGARPVVTLWCMDCLSTVREFDQANAWAEVQQEVAAHFNELGGGRP